jgi:hypothetical protein
LSSRGCFFVSKIMDHLFICRRIVQQDCEGISAMRISASWNSIYVLQQRNPHCRILRTCLYPPLDFTRLILPYETAYPILTYKGKSSSHVPAQCLPEISAGAVRVGAGLTDDRATGLQSTTQDLIIEVSITCSSPGV